MVYLLHFFSSLYNCGTGILYRTFFMMLGIQMIKSQVPAELTLKYLWNDFAWNIIHFIVLNIKWWLGFGEFVVAFLLFLFLFWTWSLTVYICQEYEILLTQPWDGWCFDYRHAPPCLRYYVLLLFCLFACIVWVLFFEAGSLWLSLVKVTL